MSPTLPPLYCLFNVSKIERELMMYKNYLPAETKVLRGLNYESVCISIIDSALREMMLGICC